MQNGEKKVGEWSEGKRIRWIVDGAAAANANTNNNNNNNNGNTN